MAGRSRATLLCHYKTGESVSDCGHFVGPRSSLLDDRHVESSVPRQTSTALSPCCDLRL